jgi:uncharacterized membrane protein
MSQIKNTLNNNIPSAVGRKEYTDEKGAKHSEFTIDPSISGAAKGAAAGAIVAGPVGAVIGGAIGFVFGKTN